MRKAVITGIYGQDGSFLCEYLLKNGYEVHGFVKKNLSDNSKRIKEHFRENSIFPIEHLVDLYDFTSVKDALDGIKPDEVYHLAASHVSSEGNFDNEIFVYQRNVLATSNILAATSQCNPAGKVVTAGSCLVYDDTDTVLQNEITPPKTISFYGLAKIAENDLVRLYRKKGLFCCTAVLYNHESIRRAPSFVTRKIIQNLVRLKRGEISSFTLGGLEQKKDWGYAEDYAIGMYRMLQQGTPSDLIFSTGTQHSIRDLLDLCASYLGLKDYMSCIEIDKGLINRRLSSVLCGDSSRAVESGILQHTVSFEQLFINMIEKELQKEI